MKNSSFRKDHVLKAKLLSLLLLISVFIAAGCAGVKLGTLPTPPSSSGLRVFVKAITEEAKYPMRISHEDFELITYKMAKNYFSGKRGVYDIVPLEEVHLITDKEELTAWQWRKDDWALAVEVGRRLQAEYALILERQNFAKFFQQRFVLINVNTHKKFEVITTGLAGGLISPKRALVPAFLKGLPRSPMFGVNCSHGIESWLLLCSTGR
jgi:hypothetical protein